MKSQRLISTVLFTDVVGSTERAAELGDRAWRELQERHHAIVREELRRWGGTEVTEAGDGFFSLFDSPARAIVCACTIRDRVSELGLQIRGGLHMGQIERDPDGSAGGIAVHLGARVEGKAAPGEVVVTSAVRDAESGSGFGFEDLGRHQLKGIPREWRLFRVTGLPDDAAGLAPGVWQRVHHRVGSRRLVVAAVAVVVAVVLGYGVVRVMVPGSAVAVLPLENLTGDPDQEFFVDGMTEAMITELSKIGSVRVISRRSVLRYRGSDTPISEIAEELGVDGVVEGSVARSGDQVRITAQLVHAGSDAHVWAESYDGDVGNVLILQSNVARDIAREIEVALTPEEEARLAAGRSVNPKTYEAYLKGMFHLNKSGPEDFQKGMAYLHEAVEMNPGDPLAYAGLALGYATLGHGPDPPPDAWPKAREAAERALKLDPMLAEAHAAMADVKTYYEWDWEGAEEAFLRANELNPSLAMNHYHYAWYLYLFSRMDEAIEEHERAQELDPLTPLHTAYLGALYRVAGRYEDAEREARKTIEMSEESAFGWHVLGNVLRDAGRFEEAIAAHQRAAEIHPARIAALAKTYVIAGRMEEALEILSELEAQDSSPWLALKLAEIHTLLGNIDEAFRWLAYEPPHAFFPWVRVLPRYEPLWADPRFQEILNRLGLPR
jgi:TolB-like protein/Tfp pilus assembly protein PilF